LATPEPIRDWSLTSLREKLIKIGAKVVSSGRYIAFQMAEVAIRKNHFADILRSRNCDRRPPLRPRKAFNCYGFGTNSRGTCVHMTESPPRNSGETHRPTNLFGAHFQTARFFEFFTGGM
jgi:hypothetical protein